jgi:hypothetical protein
LIFPRKKEILKKGKEEETNLGYGALWEVERSFSTTGKGKEFLPIYSSPAIQKWKADHGVTCQPGSPANASVKDRGLENQASNGSHPPLISTKGR